MSNSNHISLIRKSPIALARQGFSLVELLVVIAIIGIIAAIAIPNIGSMTQQATLATTQRNSQSVASMVAAAQAAGYTNTIADVPTIVAAVCTTGLTGSGNFATNSFYVPLTGNALTNVENSSYLSVNTTNNQLIYTPPAQ